MAVLDRAYSVLAFCGLLQLATGVFLFATMAYSFVFPLHVLTLLTNVPIANFGGSAAVGWQQVAVAFGMHSYADALSGYRQLTARSSKGRGITRQVTTWNSSRFVISLLWLLKMLQGLTTFNAEAGRPLWAFTPLAWAFLVVLAVDCVVTRPLAVYYQRQVEDVTRVAADIGAEQREYDGLSFVQKCTRFVFYYEAVLSGLSGAVFFMFPNLLMWLYALPAADSEPVTLWCLSQFGVLVMTFGLYQMNSEIDNNTFMVVWWLLLDYVWMYVYWVGIAARLGPWNPFTFSGANIWCHSAFHADSSLALARMVCLLFIALNGRPKAAAATATTAPASPKKKN